MYGNTTEEVDVTAKVRTPPDSPTLDDRWVEESGSDSEPIAMDDDGKSLDDKADGDGKPLGDKAEGDGKWLGDNAEGGGKPEVARDLPTYGRAWHTRTAAWRKAAFGNVGGFIKQQAYQERKRSLNLARKAWVREFGMGKAIPEELWPKMPDGSKRHWIPDDSWLSDDQRREEWCATYVAEYYAMNPGVQSSSAASSWE